MHELSIALGIVRIAEEQVRLHRAKYVESIELEIGTLAGVEFDALDFAWPEAVRRTVLEHAERHLDIVPARARCTDCDCLFDAQSLFDACPECGTLWTELVQGRELRVKALTVHE